MAKDPAFLFYPGDASEDTQFMNRLERGAYFDILKAQKKFGRFSLDQLKKVLGNDFDSVWPSLQMSLTCVEDMYFIDWVDASISKRKEYSESRRNNRRGANDPSKGNISNTHDEILDNTSPSYVEHMENGNENTNTNPPEGVAGETVEQDFITGAGVLIVPELLTSWKERTPGYVSDPKNDFTPIREIATYIAKTKSMPRITGLQETKLIKDWFIEIVDFIKTDAHFKNYQLSQVAKYFNNIATKMRNAATPGQVPAGPGPKKSIIQNNIAANQTASDEIKKKYA